MTLHIPESISFETKEGEGGVFFSSETSLSRHSCQNIIYFKNGSETITRRKVRAPSNYYIKKKKQRARNLRAQFKRRLGACKIVFPP